MKNIIKLTAWSGIALCSYIVLTSTSLVTQPQEVAQAYFTCMTEQGDMVERIAESRCIDSLVAEYGFELTDEGLAIVHDILDESL